MSKLLNQPQVQPLLSDEHFSVGGTLIEEWMSHKSFMRADDVTETLQLALEASGIDEAKVAHHPRLLSDNGSSYIAGELAE
jgi:hypothetical protein